ncbi:MAG: FtsX-like permease family protein [Deltaproteobacteria bacterium]|nr:FtsX-like permease family protein [Deltaproteobacteria bacterium]
MMLALPFSVLRHGWRSVRSGGLPFFFAVLMTALGLFSLTAFGMLLWNFRSVARTVGESVAAVAFLDDRIGEQGAAAAEEVRARIALLPSVGGARLLTPEEALDRARRGLGSADALRGTAGLQMPWVVQVVPLFSLEGDEERDVLVQRLGAIAGVAEVMHPTGELRRVDALMRLLNGAGLFLAVLIALVVVVVVSNAVRLTVLVRRDEIAIQKLVGASDAFVALPLLLSGVVQGVLGAVCALAALAAASSSLAQVARVALSGALGAFHVQAPPPWMLALVVVAGAGLGALGASLSVVRFLRTA